jgi:hypothetical protein
VAWEERLRKATQTQTQTQTQAQAQTQKEAKALLTQLVQWQRKASWFSIAQSHLANQIWLQKKPCWQVTNTIQYDNRNNHKADELVRRINSINVVRPILPSVLTDGKEYLKTRASALKTQ